MIPAMPRCFSATFLFIALALLAAGCGSSSSSSSTSTSATASPGTTATQGGVSTSTNAESTPSTTTPPATSAPGGSGAGSGRDRSIQNYGSAAAGAEQTALKGATFSFLSALAAADYTKVCADLSAANLAELQGFAKLKHQQASCHSILKMLISPSGLPEARRAAQGTFTSARVSGNTAFVLFRPKGGVPSYVVMKREGGSWKAISIAPGSPLNP